jgi:hypothetical protein
VAFVIKMIRQFKKSQDFNFFMNLPVLEKGEVNRRSFFSSDSILEPLSTSVYYLEHKNGQDPGKSGTLFEPKKVDKVS